MNDAKIVVGIDIGTSKVVTLIAKVSDSINILGVSEVKSTGIRKGQIVDIEEAVLAINNSLEGAERMAGYSASHVVASIGGSHVESQNSKGVVAVSAPEGEIREAKEPVAFGLVALKLTFVMDEKKGDLDPLDPRYHNLR